MFFELSGTLQTEICGVQEWIEDIAAYVKSLDPNHLVTVGSIGWYGASTPER
jgi:endo-1,4-beta-mannosidase